MTRNVYTVQTHADLDGSGLSSKGKALVLARLSDKGTDTVCCVDRWLVEDKGFNPIENSNTILAVDSVEAETEDAWRIASKGVTDWVPKSCAELYVAASDDIDTASAPQRGLDAFGVEL